MSYHGYLPLIKQFLHTLPHPPCLLEVGVDRGVSFLTLVNFLARTKAEFFALGVDVKVQEQVRIMLANADLQPKQTAYLMEENSLTLLPKMIDQGLKFDMILLDGDHNYHTVSTELKYIEKLIHDHTAILIDDYDGRWSDRDLWYAEREGYEENQHVTRKVDTEKHGVKAAVDEWLASHPGWQKVKSIPGEPVLLAKTPPDGVQQ